MGQPVKPSDPSRGSYSKYEAWQDLLMEAQFRPFETRSKGKLITLQRGQLMAARSWLARRWNWTEKTVRVFLATLEADFMVRRDCGQQKGQQRANTVNVITVCNYDIYQTAIELMEMEKGQQKDQPGASQGPQYNKETNKQITTLNTRSRVDLDILETKLFEAVNGAMASPAIAPQVLVLSDPIQWIESGCDLEMDILPAVKARAHRMRPGSVKSWSYFTDAVADARARRETPMPVGHAPPNPNWNEKHSPARAYLFRKEPASG
jgi:hypothetical protein